MMLCEGGIVSAIAERIQDERFCSIQPTDKLGAKSRTTEGAENTTPRARRNFFTLASAPLRDHSSTASPLSKGPCSTNSAGSQRTMCLGFPEVQPERVLSIPFKHRKAQRSQT